MNKKLTILIVFAILSAFNGQQLHANASAKKNLKLIFVAPAIENTLNIILLGTIYDGNPYKGVALIKNLDTRQIKAFRVGDEIFFGGKLVEVHRHKMIFDLKNYAMVGNKTEARAVAKSKAATKSMIAEDGFERKGTDIGMTSEYRDNLINKKLKDILFQAEAAPVIQNGQIAGFKLLQIDEGSIFDKFGLIDEDVVTHINGKELNNVAQTINFLHSLKSSDDLEITVVRNGAPISVNVRVR